MQHNETGISTNLTLPILITHTLIYSGPGQLSRYSDSLWAGRSGDRIPVGESFFAPVQNRPWPTEPPTQRVPGLSRWQSGYPPQLEKGKAVPLLARSGPEGTRKLRLSDYMTTAQDGGKVVSLTHRPLLPPGNAPGFLLEAESTPGP